MGGNILNEISKNGINQIIYFLPIALFGRNYILIKNSHTFDELFPPNYNILGGIIFNEANQKNMHKFDELFPPIYIFRDKLYMMKYDELFPPNYIVLEELCSMK